MDSTDREQLRHEMDRAKQLEYLSSVENERNRIGGQIEQLKRQIGQLTQKKIDLDKEWRDGILSVQATQCRPGPAPQKTKKLDPRKKTASSVESALKGASAEKLAKIAELLQKAGIEI